MSFDTEVLIVGAGMSGLGLAVQIVRNFGIRNFELVEKSEDVGGTWLANTYPGCVLVSYLDPYYVICTLTSLCTCLILYKAGIFYIEISNAFFT